VVVAAPPRITSTTEPRPELIYTFWVSVPVISARMRLIMSFVRSASLIALVAAERALVEADIGRYKRVIGDALRSRTEGWQTTEVAIAITSLNRMPELGGQNTFASHECRCGGLTSPAISFR
jgi:hypothetical protein